MDNNLTDSFRMALMTQAMVVSIFILIIAYYYFFAVVIVPLFVIFLFAANYYRASAREIKVRTRACRPPGALIPSI